nr:hopanoid-associated RND transporter HpnN [uncultured bacterium]
MRPSAPQREENSLLRGFLRLLTRFVTRRARFSLWIIAIVSIVAIGLSVREMGFKARRADLIDPKTDLHRQWKRYADTFGEDSEIIVAIESDRAEVIERALDDLGARMESEPQAFSNVVYKGDASSLRGKGLQCFSPAELDAGLTRLKDYDPLLQGRWDLLKLDALIDRLRYQITNKAQSRTRDASAPLWRHAELLATSLSTNFENAEEFQSPWPPLLPADRLLRASGSERVHCKNDESKIGYIKALPVQEAGSVVGASASLSRLRELIAEVTPDHPDVQFGITGIPALENDEIRRSQYDMLLAVGIAFIGVTVILFLGFRGFRHPILAMTMLVAGMTWSAGYATLVVGHLNVLSVGFASVLIGIGIDYAIHYMARYIELRHEGEDIRPALLKTSTSRGASILTAALTTALAFFAATFTEFLGIAELGIIAGGSIVICALATFLVLPPLIALSDRGVDVRKIPTPFEASFVRQLIARSPRTVMIVSLLIALGISSQIVRFRNWRPESRIRYDYNAVTLQAEGTESVRVLDRMYQKTNDSLLYAVSVADSADEARALRRKFEALPSVHHVKIWRRVCRAPRSINRDG